MNSLTYHTSSSEELSLDWRSNSDLISSLACFCIFPYNHEQRDSTVDFLALYISRATHLATEDSHATRSYARAAATCFKPAKGI